MVITLYDIDFIIHSIWLSLSIFYKKFICYMHFATVLKESYRKDVAKHATYVKDMEEASTGRHKGRHNTRRRH